jgi:hypothetical protein
MAITTTMTKSFKLELLKGIHAFDADVIKVALYSSAATLDNTTTAYSATNEITGTGYTAGGKTVAVTSGYPQLNGTQADVRFDSVTWTSATFTARGALFYNSSKSNRAICAVDFGADRSPYAGDFTLNFPGGSPALVAVQ